MYCDRCGFINSINRDDDVAFCAVCGAVLVSAGVSAMALSSARERDVFVPPVDFRGSGPLLAASVPGESLLARLDREERDIFSRIDEKLPSRAFEPETEAEGPISREDGLPSISMTLDSLIEDLFGAEVNEYLTPNLLHPDETGFPLPNQAGVFAPRIPVVCDRFGRVVDSLFVIAFIVAVFLLGMTVGLWGMTQSIGA